MEDRLYQWFKVRQSELGLVLVLGFILFSNYAAMGITKVISVSGFLSQVKEHYILLVWAVDMVLLILASGLQSLIIDRFNRIKLLTGVLLIFALLYAGLPILFNLPFIPTQINYALVYLLNDQQWRFFPVLFWILVNDLFDPAKGRRLQPAIANFAFVGTICGLGIAALDARVNFGTISLLLVNSAIFLTACVLATLGLRQVKLQKAKATGKSMQEVMTEGWLFIKKVPAFSHLSLMMLIAGTVMTVLLYHTLASAKQTLGDGFQSFYAWYNLAIALASILVQSQSSWLIEKISLKRTFWIQPCIMLAATVSSLVLPNLLASIAIGQGAARTSYDTVDVSARKAFQAFVPDARRGRVSMFIDSYLPCLGTIIGSLVVFTIIVIGLQLNQPSQVYASVYLAVAIAILIVALITVQGFQKVYDSSLLNWQLKRRQRGVGLFSKFFDKEE